MVRNTAVRHVLTPRRRQDAKGTLREVLASTRDHAPSDESSFLLVFRARDFPALPALPASLLDGKEGSTVRVRQRASRKASKMGFFCESCALTLDDAIAYALGEHD
jgi:hypothetical protein